MKKIIFLTFFLLLTLQGEDNLTLLPSSEQVKTKTIFNLIDELLALEQESILLKKNFTDENSTIFNDDLASLAFKKSRILEELPNVLIKESRESDEKILASLEEKFKEASEASKKIRNKKSYDYFLNKQELLKAENSYEFYKVLFSLKENYLKGLDKNTRNELLKKNIITLQNNFFDLSYKENALLSELQKQNLDENIEEGKILFLTYKEVLLDILKNSDLFSENLIVKNFKLKDMMDYINQDSRFANKYFNVGKIFVIAFITLFLFFFRKIIYNIVYFILKKTILRMDEDEIEKTSIIGAIKNPLAALLFVLNIDLCLVILSYPAPIAKSTSTIISLSYISLFTWFFIGLIDIYGIFLFAKLAKRSGKKEIVNLLSKVTKIFVVLLGIILLLRKLNFDVSTLLASFGIGALAIALASKDIVANFFTSIVLIFDNSFSQGDEVSIDGTNGRIVEIGLRKTTIRTQENSLVFLPNSLIIGKKIENWSRRKQGRAIKIDIDIAYSTSQEKILNFLKASKELLLNNPKIAKTNEKSSYRGISYQYRQDMLSIDDLAGYKNSLSVQLSYFEKNYIRISLSCFTKTINSSEYAESKEEVFLSLIELLKKEEILLAS